MHNRTIQVFLLPSMPRERSDDYFSPFRCRNRLKVAMMEVTWACLSYNLGRWFSLRRKLSLAAASA